MPIAELLRRGINTKTYANTISLRSGNTMIQREYITRDANLAIPQY